VRGHGRHAAPRPGHGRLDAVLDSGRGSGTPRTPGRPQWFTIGMRLELVDGSVRTLDAVGVQSGKGNGAVDDVPDGLPKGETCLAVRGGGEHVFVKVGGAPDRTSVLQRKLQRYTVEPSDDQASRLALMRSTTSVVNSVVPTWPPRSGVLTPAAVASRTDS
jgi:hypothetical protein